MSPRDASPRLGRGLAALLGETAPRSSDAQGVRSLPLDLLEPGPFQPRSSIAEPELQELAASIRSRGILQALLVRTHPTRPGTYQIIAGERRWRAAALAGLHEVPALLRDLSDTDAMAAALVENLQRQDLNTLEEAEGYQRLMDEFGLTQELLAGAVGKSRAHVGNTLRLLTATPAVKAALRAGTVSAGHARALLMHPDPDRGLSAVLANGLSVRDTEALASGKPPPEPPARRPKDPDLLALERSLSQALGLRVEITGGHHRGALRVIYGSSEQLEGLLSKLQS